MVPNLTVLAGDIDRLQLELSDAFQLADFRDVLRRPFVIGAGLVAQFVVMPALTLLLTLALDVRGSVAIGMILVVCCPAGNFSNLLTYRARGDVTLSISMTTASNVLAVLVTPIAIAFWCGLNPAADGLMRDVSIDTGDMVVEVALLIGLPFAAGLAVAWRWPAISAGARRFVEPAALVLLLLIIVAGTAGQASRYLEYVGVVALAITLQNALSLAVGYATGRGLRLPPAGVRTMTFELGVRNTGSRWCWRSASSPT